MGVSRAFLFDNRLEVFGPPMEFEEAYKHGVMKVYQHECFTINRLPKQDHLAGDMLRKVVTRPSTTVVGLKIFGIQLLGNLGDYRPSPGLVFQFDDRDFTLQTEGLSRLVDGDSFAVVASEVQRLFCYTFPADDNDTDIHNLVLITPRTKGPQHPQICLRTGAEGPLHDLFVRKNGEISSSSWRPCPEGTDDDFDDEEEEEEKLDDPRILDLFATINAKGFRKTVRRRQKSRSKSTTQHLGSKCSVEETNCRDDGNGIRLYTVPDEFHGSIHHTWKIQVSENCTPFPEINPVNCAPDPTSVEPCELLNSILMLPSKPAEEFKIFDSDEDWRSRVLNLINSIFVKICPMVPTEMSPSVSRVLAAYLMSVKKGGRKLPERREKLWNFLERELRHCNRKSRSMASRFEARYDDDPILMGAIRSVRKAGSLQDEDDSDLPSARFLSLRTSGLQEKPPVVGKYSKPVQESFTIQSNEDYLDLPSEIRIKKQKTEASKPIFYYDEAAEMQYTFNLGIDAHWKVFSTVIGYCNIFYEARKAETFSRLYNTYYEDFLYPLHEIWKSSAENEDLSYIISEYTTDVVTKWLDSCMEASYLISNSSTFRPPRPVMISEGMNFFIEVPPLPPRPVPTTKSPATTRTPYTLPSPVTTRQPITDEPTWSTTPRYPENESCAVTCNDAHVCIEVCKPLKPGEDLDKPEDECSYTCNTGPFCQKNCRSLKSHKHTLERGD